MARTGISVKLVINTTLVGIQIVAPVSNKLQIPDGDQSIKTRASKQLLFSEVPKTLVLCLKRFKQTMKGTTISSV